MKMSRSHFECTICILGIISVLSMIVVIPATATPAISVEPSYLKISQNDTFTINITVDPAGNEIYGAQYDLLFDTSILNATSQSQGTFLSQDGASTSVMSNKINNTIGKIEYGETRMVVENGVTTPDVLASITFKAIEPETRTSILNLSNVVLSDPNVTSVETEVNDGTVVINGASPAPFVPFLIYGWINDSTGAPVLNPNVRITNLNTSEVFIAETNANATSNYYQVLTTTRNVSAGDVLHFHASNANANANNNTEFDYTVTEEDINNGGFEQNIVIIVPIALPFDTGSGTYPSIPGVHKGNITPAHNVTVNQMYTYPCAGTGGHSEFVELDNETFYINATWNGYHGDYHNITFPYQFTLLANHTYNYTIRTGSYPQIHHTDALPPTPDGWINCTQFTDANGRIYYDWIPAIRFWAE